MILVGNQRGGAKDLALHLLKEENDHVSVHELRGFASDDLHAALIESFAISRATKCQQFLFSLSLNPPPDVFVSTSYFEEVINRAELQLGLQGQPRAIVFHEKAGPAGVRRHAHAVWSRIDAEEMKAVQLSHTKRKLTALSREIFLEREWSMPRGLMASEERDLRNFSFEEWGQAKRAKKDARDIKEIFKDCWAVSDSRAAFAQALDSRGYKLARGDRRGYVAVDMHGEVYSVAKWIEVRTKAVAARLGPLDEKLPTVEARKAEFAEQIAARLRNLISEEGHHRDNGRAARETQRREIVERQRQERASNENALNERWVTETAARQKRFNAGWRGLLDRLTGRMARIRNENIAAAHAALHRDRAARDRLVLDQMEERRLFEWQSRNQRRVWRERKIELVKDLRAYLPPHPEPAVGQKRAPPVEHRNSRPSNLAEQKISNAPAPQIDQDREARREAFKRKRENDRASRAFNRARGPDLTR